MRTADMADASPRADFHTGAGERLRGSGRQAGLLATEAQRLRVVGAETRALLEQAPQHRLSRSEPDIASIRFTLPDRFS
jgi:hypothetical protein